MGGWLRRAVAVEGGDGFRQPVHIRSAQGFHLFFQTLLIRKVFHNNANIVHFQALGFRARGQPGYGLEDRPVAPIRICARKRSGTGCSLSAGEILLRNRPGKKA